MPWLKGRLNRSAITLRVTSRSDPPLCAPVIQRDRRAAQQCASKRRVPRFRLRRALWEKFVSAKLWISPKLTDSPGVVDLPRMMELGPPSQRASSRRQAWRDSLRIAAVEVAAATEGAKMCVRVLQSLFDSGTQQPGPLTCLKMGRRRNSAFRG